MLTDLVIGEHSARSLHPFVVPGELAFGQYYCLGESNWLVGEVDVEEECLRQIWIFFHGGNFGMPVANML